MTKYLVECHSHTDQSDGTFTAKELVENAKNFGYNALIVTDHNTMTGVMKIKENYLDSEQHLLVIPGIELTTYFGHILVHNCDKYIDWRKVSDTNINSFIENIKHHNGVVGIAHPYDIGSPICTGCFFEYSSADLSLADYIEIWNSEDPQGKVASKRAYNTWVNELNQGKRLSCGTGRDWHRQESDGSLIGLTYVEADSLSARDITDSIKKGNYYITLGPKIDWEISDGEHSYSSGDTIEPGNYTIETSLSKATANCPEAERIKVEGIRVCTRNYTSDVMATSVEHQLTTDSFELQEKDYVRLEVIGTYLGEKQIVAFTNPVYIR